MVKKVLGGVKKGSFYCRCRPPGGKKSVTRGRKKKTVQEAGGKKGCTLPLPQGIRGQITPLSQLYARYKTYITRGLDDAAKTIPRLRCGTP